MKLIKPVAIVTTALSVAGSLALAGPARAAAAAPTAHAAHPAQPPWLPYRSAPFVDAPGAVCSFGVTGTPVRDREQYRTLESYPNGDPKLQEFRGPLYYRYTNQTTGKSVVRNLSGYGFFRYARDGGSTDLFLSHGGITVPQGNAGFAAGEWVFSGLFTVSVTAGGAISVTLFHARAEDMCRTLAGS